MAKTKVLFSISHMGSIVPHVINARELVIRGHPDIEFVHTFPSHVPYENGMNRTAHTLRQNKDIEWWLHMDSDNPLLRDPIPLIEYDKDFIGFPTPMARTSPYALTVMNYGMEARDGSFDLSLDKFTGLQRVDGIGSGSFLMNRRVVEKLHMPFVRVVDEWGRVWRGADINLCCQIRANEMEVWCAADHPCDHIKGKISLMHVYIRERWKALTDAHKPWPIVVVGTGRCGTSTVSAWLHEHCDIDMGYVDDPNAEAPSYKSMNAVRIRDDDLAGWTCGVFMRSWFNYRINKPWGFKDPSSAHFINDYVHVFPHSKFIRCVRNRDDVIESLQRNYGYTPEEAAEFHDSRTKALDDCQEHNPDSFITVPFESIVDGSYCQILSEEFLAKNWRTGELSEKLTIPESARI